jgi:hypothetical protein
MLKLLITLLNGVSIHPITTKIQVSFLTQLTEKKEAAKGFHHEANGDFKTECNGCDRRKLRMDQQHCNLVLWSNYKVKRRKPVQNKIFQSMHPICNKTLK